MDFNFRESFQAYSNVELLNIIGEADKYQPEAVEAARHILGGREVHDNDYELANGFKAAQKGAEGSKEESLSDFLESVIEEAPDPKVIGQVNILYIVQTLLYVWYILALIKPLDAFQQCEECSVVSADFLTMIYPAVYIPVGMLLLIRRKRWGWFLLVGFYIVKSLTGVLDICYYIYYLKTFSSAQYPAMAGGIVYMLMRIGLVLFLYKPAIAAYFNVNERAKRNTMIISIVITIVLSTFAALWLFTVKSM
jgi:hypothetical protein